MSSSYAGNLEFFLNIMFTTEEAVAIYLLSCKKNDKIVTDHIFLLFLNEITRFLR